MSLRPLIFFNPPTTPAASLTQNRFSSVLVFHKQRPKLCSKFVRPATVARLVRVRPQHTHKTILLVWRDPRANVDPPGRTRDAVASGVKVDGQPRRRRQGRPSPGGGGSRRCPTGLEPSERGQPWREQDARQDRYPTAESDHVQPPEPKPVPRSRTADDSRVVWLVQGHPPATASSQHHPLPSCQPAYLGLVLPPLFRRRRARRTTDHVRRRPQHASPIRHERYGEPAVAIHPSDRFVLDLRRLELTDHIIDASLEKYRRTRRRSIGSWQPREDGHGQRGREQRWERGQVRGRRVQTDHAPAGVARERPEREAELEGERVQGGERRSRCAEGAACLSGALVGVYPFFFISLCTPSSFTVSSSRLHPFVSDAHLRLPLSSFAYALALYHPAHASHSFATSLILHCFLFNDFLLHSHLIQDTCLYHFSSLPIHDPACICSCLHPHELSLLAYRTSFTFFYFVYVFHTLFFRLCLANMSSAQSRPRATQPREPLLLCCQRCRG